MDQQPGHVEVFVRLRQGGPATQFAGHQTAKSPGQFPIRGTTASRYAETLYRFAGGTSMQLPRTTSAAMPVLSPSVRCG